MAGNDDCPIRPGPTDGACVPQWIGAAKGGSKKALGRLFEHCRGYLLTVARQEIRADLRGFTRPSDVVQDTWLAFEECFSRFHGENEAELLAWLCGIVRNQVADVRKFAHRDKRDIGRQRSIQRDLFAVQPAGLLADEWETPGRALCRDEEADRLICAMSRLADADRTVIRLRNLDCLSWNVVSHKMRRSPDAVRKLWSRALKRLERELGPLDG
jgi:RNA polymerase sigma-70 factor (ECF subfamily)